MPHSPASTISRTSFTDPTSPYDNLQNLGLLDQSSISQSSMNNNQEMLSASQPKDEPELKSSPSPTMQKPKRPSMPLVSANYLNMNYPHKVPPKKPARSSVGILLDKEESVEESVANQTHSSVTTSASMFELGQSPHRAGQGW